MSIFAAIVALCVVIIIHEAGHYLAAVWTGMKVDRFSVFGIGPTILKLGTWRGTEFVISAIPFGAFVLIRGMEPNDEGEPAGDAIDDDAWAKAIGAAKGSARAREVPAVASPNFRDKPLWARAAVLAGGPVANYLAAMLLLFGLFTVAGERGPVTRIEISEVVAGKPAEVAGLQVGDRIVELDGVAIDPAAGSKPLIDVIKAHPGEPLAVTVERGGQAVSAIVEPTAEGKIGAGLDPTGDRIAMGVGEAAVLAVQGPLDLSKRQLVGLYLLVTGQLDAEVQGPVGIVKGIATSIERGFIPFVTMAAMISTLLGLFNLLPLPALDGGRLTFLGYEALARRRAKPGVEEKVHGYGMLALLVLIAVVTVRDLGVFDKVRSFL
jgi:regulator of sigma E protease